MPDDNNTKAIQTEEEDFSHLTEKNINFKCFEGMGARLDKFEVVNTKAFILQLELDGKLYKGWFIEAIDSFAPVNLIHNTLKRRHPTFYKRDKTHRSDVTKKPKKLNVYSRKNYPRGYVDAYNIVEARLRYGRDKKLPNFNSLNAAGSLPSQSKEDNREKK